LLALNYIMREFIDFFHILLPIPISCPACKYRSSCYGLSDFNVFYLALWLRFYLSMSSGVLA
jgi:hypothetical protein